jgi:predicted Zn-dependent protease with MMP-like domain
MHDDDLPELMGRRYTRFVERLKASDHMLAAEEFTKLLALLRRNDAKIPPRLLSAMMESWIDLFWQCRRHDLMLTAADDAIAIFGADPEWSFAKGESLFYLGRFDEARKILEELTTEDFEEPMIYYLLACLAERRGDIESTQRLFQSANRLDPKGFIIPIEITEDVAQQTYRDCLAELPEQIAWQIKDVPIFVDALPSDELLRSCDPPIDPLVMGLFMGQPQGAGESPWPSDQPRILLFHRNIAKLAGDFEAIEDELRKTLFHEVGHFLGFDEDQLEEMGLG